MNAGRKSMSLFALLLITLTTACSTSLTGAINPEASDGAICETLEEPVGNLAESLLRYNEQTHPNVIITSVKVIKGFDTGCD